VSDPGCVFCGILTGSVPASVVLEDDETIAFLDIAPITPGHTLVVPRGHAGSLAELAPEAGAAVFRTAMRIAAALRRSGLQVEGVNLLLSDGAAAGQEVPHVHLHVVPRFPGDGLQIRTASREPTRSDLEASAVAIRAALERPG
jgi:diadenosine tetraphosphate (Ap4A) HIT family hydrolase